MRVKEEVEEASTVTSMVSVLKSMRVGARKSRLRLTLELPTCIVVLVEAEREAVGKSIMLEMGQVDWSILLKKEALALVRMVME